MDLDHANAAARDLLHVRLHILAVPRMHAAAGDQPPGILFAVVHHPLVHLGGEAHHFRRNIIDQHRALHAHRIQVLQERLRGAAVFNDVIKSTAGLFHYLHRAGFEHVIRLDVNVAVGDEHPAISN